LSSSSKRYLSSSRLSPVSNNLRNAAVEPLLLLRADNAAHALACTTDADMTLPRCTIVRRLSFRHEVAEVFVPMALIWRGRLDSAAGFMRGFALRKSAQFPSSHWLPRFSSPGAAAPNRQAAL
jgi:hypothetical protein